MEVTYWKVAITEHTTRYIVVPAENEEEAKKIAGELFVLPEHHQIDYGKAHKVMKPYKF